MYNGSQGKVHQKLSKIVYFLFDCQYLEIKFYLRVITHAFKQYKISKIE